MSYHTCIMANIITKILPCSTIVLDVKSYLSCNVIKWLQRHKSKVNKRFRWCTHQISRSQKSSRVNHGTFSKFVAFKGEKKKKHWNSQHVIHLSAVNPQLITLRYFPFNTRVSTDKEILVVMNYF